MATTSMIKVREETNLAGVLKSQLLSTGLSLTAKFFDTKTGVQRTPQSDTLTFTLNKNNSKAERVRCTVHSTDATTGITTLTIDAAGRALPAYGVGAGAASGYQHEIGDPIGLVTEHEPTAQILGWIAGTLASGSNTLRIGDGTDSNIRIYANNNDANSPYLGWDAASNTWVVANDGVSSVALPGGAGAYTAGDGLTLTASDFDIDLTDTAIFSTTGVATRVPLGNGSGKLDTSWITPAPFTTYISDHAAIVGGTTSNADADHTHAGLSASVTAGEAVDGSTTSKPLALLGNNFKGMIYAEANGQFMFSTLTGTSTAIGDVDARAKQGQSFTITDALAETLKVETITIMMEITGAPGDYVTLELSADNGSGYPSATILTNGTATAIQGSTISGDARPVKFTFATPPTITSGTTYHWAIRRSTISGGASALDAANYYRLFTAGADTFTGSSSSYTASTLTWSGTSTTDYQFILVYNRDYDGKAYITDGDDLSRTRFKGFTKSNVAADAALAMITHGHVDGLSLTAGADYWLDTSSGGLTPTAPSPTTTWDGLVPVVKVGTAVNTTTLGIEPGYEAVLSITGNIYTSGQPITQAAQDAQFDLFIETGFTPRKFEIRYKLSNVNATAGDDRYVVTRFLRTTQMSSFYVTGAEPAATDISETALGYVTVQAIYENGFLLRIFSSEATAEAMAALHIFIES